MVFKELFFGVLNAVVVRQKIIVTYFDNIIHFLQCCVNNIIKTNKLCKFKNKEYANEIWVNFLADKGFFPLQN